MSTDVPIPLLDPVVLTGLVAKFSAPAQLTMLNRVNQVPQPAPQVSWDIIKGSRNVAHLNGPNSEADVVDKLGRSSQTATVASIREKKTFEATTLRWLRSPGSLHVARAEEAIMREVQDLNQRFDFKAEQLLLSAMTGTLSDTIKGASFTVNYGFRSDHVIASPTTAWSTATAIDIVRDLRSWKRLVIRHGQVPPRDTFCNEFTMTEIVNKFTLTSSGGAGGITGLMSDRMKDEYYQSGMMRGFMDLTWNVVETVYADDSGNLKNFIGDNALYLGNYTDQRPIELYVGPNPDHDAPDGFAGKFAKTFKQPDPSGLQYLLDWNIIPAITRPEQMLYVQNVGFDTSTDGAFLN